jgi:hypothetical protein
MMPFYHKIFVAQASCLWEPAGILPAIAATPLGTADTTALDRLGRRHPLARISKFLLFICRFPSVENGPGGIYLSG